MGGREGADSVVEPHEGVKRLGRGDVPARAPAVPDSGVGADPLGRRLSVDHDPAVIRISQLTILREAPSLRRSFNGKLRQIGKVDSAGLGNAEGRCQRLGRWRLLSAPGTDTGWGGRLVRR